ncbi:hypothetical protein VPNG_08990 [Cytospora leucostoma]|uniref:RING-type domain-containing protein n=1 Tax=Cytospora leucostoma TaxID=1230097 RepID=A0A423VZV3_9PEZI|nr:hypothetical protein VPNG_08990 [Cytospora leucostoma]
MQSYSYHLKIELYPSSNPSSTDPPVAGGSSGLSRSIWQPDTASSIFDSLPSHARRDEQLASSAWKKREKQKSISNLEDYLPQEDRRLLHRNPARVIDCGASRPTATIEGEEDEHSIAISNLKTNTKRERSRSFEQPGYQAGIGPRTAGRDWRFGPIRIESFDVPHGSRGTALTPTLPDMAGSSHPSPAASLGPNLGGPGTDTKGEFVPLVGKNTEAGWGVVHLYREPHDVEVSSTASESLNGEDGTILCVPAVPGYLSPIAFLNFVGQKWMGQVAHYRMLMTSALGTYMVLMKFRDHKAAEAWRKEFDGKAFGPMRHSNAEQEEGICHVTFIKSITIETPSQPKASSSKGSAVVGHLNSLKPFPPPTPDLVELPTCTVCLERMDDTSGLITIPCQHVFHCTCLQSWRGSGCPVCRATNPAPASVDPNDPYSHPFGHGISNICIKCDTTDDLWICLICGNVGCGRYKGGHAKEHWKETAHCFSLELETQHVWDYAGDMWVHRLIREKGEGKVVEFPSTNMAAANNRDGSNNNNNNDTQQFGPDMDVVPRAKLDNIGMEYTHLLTSQLESQRVYFDEIVSKAADKAAKAAAAAESASAQAAEAMGRLRVLEAEHEALRAETIPQLERDLARERRRADKAAELARRMGQSLQEEKKINEGLMDKVRHVGSEAEALRAENARLAGEVAEQRDMNRDLSMFISGQEKLREMEGEGKVTAEELEGGEASVPERRGGGKGGKGGKGKGKK